MKITDITVQVKNNSRYNVFIDGEFVFGINADDLLYHGLVVGMELEQEQFDNLLNEIEYAKARDAAVGYLGRGARAVKEVVTKLKDKEFSEITIVRVIEMLVSHGYLDDVAFAVRLIRHRADVSNHGKRRIVAELARKGVSRDNIVAAFNQLKDEMEDSDNDTSEQEQEHAAARRALEKKLRNKDVATMLADHAEKTRLVGFLARRGFSYDVIKAVLRDVAQED